MWTKQVRMAVLALGLTALLHGVAAAAAVPLNCLDGRWLQVTVSCKGNDLVPATGELIKKSASLTAYVHFEWNGASYQVKVYSQEHAWGAWNLYLNIPTQPATAATTGVYLHYFQLEMANPDFYVALRDEGFITVSVDGAGNVTRVSYKATVPVTGSYTGGPNDFFGSAKVKSTEVSVADLPFVP